LRCFDVSVLPAQLGWEAQLELGFEARAGRTVLVRRTHRGPLVVQRPFYPEGGVCHVYLLHPPGGVVGGDQLTVNANVESGGQALITTPAAGKFYRSCGPTATLRQLLRVQSGSALEWLPQETILFAGCQLNMATRVELAADARFIGWEVLCLGRPAANESYSTGACRQRFELWRDGEPILVERALLQGESPMLAAPWGLAGRSVTGTMVATSAGKVQLELVREAVHGRDDDLFSATLLGDVLLCRFLGRQAEAARECFAAAWTAIRPSLLQRQACVPRIWNT
jgi:urease accessory protein